MRETTKKSNINLRQIVRDELELVKIDWLDAFINKVSEFKDQVLTMLDKVMGELKTIREEQTIMSGRLPETNDMLEDHETRIKNLERKIPINL